MHIDISGWKFGGWSALQPQEDALISVAMMSVLLGNLHELSCERLDIRSLLMDETESS
jgi:hypothetical protein